jgi:iron complex outermembrane receptor protein
VGYEAGLKSEGFGGRLGATLAVFRQQLDNSPIPDPFDENASISAGQQRTDGVEIEVSGSPVDGLTLGFSAAWYDGEYTDKADPAYGMKPYAFIESQYTVFASYELQAGALRGLGFGITAVSLGDRWLGYPGMSEWVDNAEDEVRLDGYERYDFNVFYRGFKHWDIALQVRNATDETYIERFRDIESNNYFGAPRAYLLRAEYLFGSN